MSATWARTMRNEQLGRLIRRVIELDDLAGEAQPLAGILHPRISSARRPALSVGIAAAVAVAMLLPFGANRDYRTYAAPAMVIDYAPAHHGVDDSRIDTFHTCPTEDAFALVLFRAWDTDCQCVAWKLHEFADGRALMRLAAGEALEIPLDVSNSPPVEQVVVFAVSNRRDELPATAREAEELLACLNTTLPPSALGEQPVCCAAPVESCLPPGVALVQRSFVVE